MSERRRSSPNSWLIALAILAGVTSGPTPAQSQESSGSLIAGTRQRGNDLQTMSEAEILGHIYGGAESLEAALTRNQVAFESAGPDPFSLASLWVERGVLYARANRMVEARRAIAAARSVARLTDVPLLEAVVLLRSGNFLSMLERFEDVISYLEEVVKLLSRQHLGEMGRWILEATYYHLAQAYDRLGLTDMGQIAKKEFVRFVEESSPPGMHQLDWENAVDQFLDTSLKVFPDLIGPEGRRARDKIKALLGILEPLAQMADATEAEKYFRQVDPPPDMPGFRRVTASLADVTHLIGIVWDGGDVEATTHRFLKQARRMFRRFLRLQASGIVRLNSLQEAQLLMASALTEVLLRDRPSRDAVGNSKKAIALLESYVDDMRVDEAIIGFIDDDGQQLYRLAVEILARGSPEEAFSYAEKGRAWTLRRLLGNPRKVSQLSRREREDLTGNSAHEEYEIHRLQSKFTPGVAAALVPVDPVSFELLQGEVLPPDSTLLTYFPGLRRPGLPRLRAWTVHRNGIEMTPILGSEEEWQEVVCQIRALAWQGISPGARGAAVNRGARLITGCGNEEGAPSAALYRRLIAPIAPQLRHHHLIIVPYGLLHHLPFAALRNPETNRYLVQDFTLSLAPSASALSLLSQRTTHTTRERETLVLGDPATALEPLKGARQEAVTVAALLGSEPLLGEMATESRIYENAGRIRLLHLAAHSQYDSGSPLFSRVYLSGDDEHDGTLEMREIWDQLDLGGTQLVVLSGCDTGLAEVGRGDDARGLTYAFLVAGSRAVISALWPVDDAASARLMAAFYRRYLQGATAAEALQAAQVEMLEQSDTAAPYYWAGFTLTGDPESRWRP